MFRKVVAVVMMLGAADAVPAKSCCSSTPEPAPYPVGGQCGFGHASCAAGTSCLEACTAGAGAEAGVTGTFICTKNCNSDADCASLGAGFVCGVQCTTSGRSCIK